MKLFFGTALALTLLSAFQSAAVPDPLADFRDLAAAAGLNARTVIGGERTKQFILETTGGGVAIVDYDDDGWPDIFLVNGARRSLSAADAAPVSHLYRNNHDGTFADVTEKAGVAGKGWGQGVCAGDYDNDGHIDLFVTYYGHQVLYRNNGDGTFNDVTRGSGLSLSKPRWNTGCAFLDFNRDGRLDLFVSAYVDYADATRYAPGSRDNCFWKGLGVMCGPHGLAGSSNALYRGNPDGTFTNVSEEAGLLKPRPAYGLTPLVLDYDNDGWPDVYVANDSSPSLLFHNNGNGTFKEVGLQAGVALNADGRAQAGMGVGAGDYNRDGWLDIVKTNFDDDTTSLYRNLGHGTFDDATVAGGLGSTPRIWAGARGSSTSTWTHGPTSSSSTAMFIRRRIASAGATAMSSRRSCTAISAMDASRMCRSGQDPESLPRKRRAAPPSATFSTQGGRKSS